MSSHLAPFLSNNELPSENILHDIKKAMEEPMEKLSKSQAEIDRVEKYLQELRDTHEEFKISLNPYNTVLSPIRRFPLDILLEIFLHCLPTQRNPVMSPSEAPLLLTRICRTWRDTALSSPRIWARLHIPFSEVILEPDIPLTIPDDTMALHHVRVMDRRCKVVAEWLSRSGDCPLSISLHYIRPTRFTLQHSTAKPLTAHSETAARRLLKIILPLVKRCKDLQLSIPWDIYQEIQTEVATDGISTLQSLKVDFSQRIPHNTSEPQVLMFQAPNLQRLSVGSADLWNIKNIPALMKNLTVLNCHASFLNVDILKLLNELPNLVHFKGRLVDAEDHVEFFEPVMVSIPSLQSLCVTDGGSVHISTKVYSCIDAPLLKWVSYQRYTFYRNLSVEHELNGIPLPALPLLQQSVGVKKLSLEQYGLQTEDIITSFRLLHSLSHLVIGDSRPSARYLGRLGQPLKKSQSENFDLNLLIIDEHSSREEILLPNLLAFEAHWVSNITDETLLRFITSRMNPNSKNGIAVLKLVRVTLARPKQKDISEEVYRCAKAAGIELELDLVYAPRQQNYLDPFSSSYGLTMDGHSTWYLDDLEDSDVMFY